MTDFDPTDYGLQEQTEQISRRQRRKLEASEKEAAELRAKIADMERREMFRDAGIDPSDPQQRYFVRGYDGEMTIEAIKQAGVEAGYIKTTQIPPEEQQGHLAAQAAAAGAQVPGAAPDFGAQLAEMAKKTFAATDDIGRSAHIAEIARMARDAGVRIPVT